jgi:hypothetical protein
MVKLNLIYYQEWNLITDVFICNKTLDSLINSSRNNGILLLSTTMANSPDTFTRGKGYLEPLLARLRAERANNLIPRSLRSGRILDIGCGTYPYFLSTTAFSHKLSWTNCH